MNATSLRERVLGASERVFPWVLGVGFAFSNVPRFYWIGVGMLLFAALWYAAWNWRAAFASPWALLVLGFFAAIALKDGLLWTLGSGRFNAFAKSGSRIVSLFGVAAMLAAYRKDASERFFGLALGVSAALIAAEAFLVRAGKAAQPVMNPNTFGMLFAWLPLFAVLRLREKGKAWTEALAAFIGLAGLVILSFDGIKAMGDRTAPLAYLLALLYVYLANPSLLRRREGATGEPWPRRLLCAEVVGAIIAIALLSTVYVPAVDSLLSRRQELWMAYAQKGAERPFLGWGYTEGEENRALVGAELKGKPIYEEFMGMGLGPHNAILAMFFENGALFALAYAALLWLRAKKTASRAGLFDVSLVAYIAFMSADAMAPGGITFLGFYLGACLLSPLHDEPRPAEAAA